MAMTRKILRFGPSISSLRTVIVNVKELINGENKDSPHIHVLKTLSALLIAGFFILDHYIWLFRVNSYLTIKGRIGFQLKIKNLI